MLTNGTDDIEKYLPTIDKMDGDDAMGKEDSLVNFCVGMDCSRKAKKDCPASMCFKCCSQSESIQLCLVHSLRKRKKEEEERLFVEGLDVFNKVKRTLEHFEKSFEAYGQTVLIWCFKDFCRNKKWNEDTFNSQLEKQARIDRRNRQNNNGKTASCRRAATSRYGLSKTKIKFQKILAQWEGRRGIAQGTL